MIRRQVGNDFWLITQDEHARISGQLAAQIGNESFQPPGSESSLLGISMHDCGWVLHDDAPTLNSRKFPIDVFETTRQIGLRVWEESADRATARDDYAGLLVSLHSLALSVFVTEQSPMNGKPWDMSEPRTRFEVNRFQHKIIELQEALRQRLGMRTDRPLKHGLAEGSRDAKEQRLECDFRWLQAMDRLSLVICCNPPPFDRLEPVVPRPAELPVCIRASRPAPNAVLINPWPFDRPVVEVIVPFRRLPAEQFENDEHFRSMYRDAPLEQFTATIQGHTI